MSAEEAMQKIYDIMKKSTDEAGKPMFFRTQRMALLRWTLESILEIVNGYYDLIPEDVSR